MINKQLHSKLFVLLLLEATREDNAIEKASHSAPLFFGQLQNNQIQEIFSMNDVDKEVEICSVDDSQTSGSSLPGP